MSRAVTVSVVIPAYNAAAFIERTLDTVRAQTFDDHETIVVDDGSVDRTAEVVSAYFSKHGMNGRLLRQENRGQAAARNAGMRAARAGFVALLDADDLWDPEKLAVVMAEFGRQPEVDLICHNERITLGGKVVRVSDRRMPRGNVYDALLFGGNLLSPSATVIRRDSALAIGGFDERRDYISVEDYDFWMRFSRGRQIRFLNRVLGEYVLRDESSSRDIVGHHAALEGMLRQHFEAFLRSHSGPAARLRVRRRLARVYRSAARQLIAYGERRSDQHVFVRRMLRTYPFELRNLAVAALWIAGFVRRSSVAGLARV